MTGHQKIDSQHHALEQLIQQLDAICELHDKPGSSCIECSAEFRAACTNRATAALENLLDFLSEHFSYEDNLMRQLQKIPECAQYIGEHKWAHTEIVGQLSEEIDNFDRENPKQSLLQIQNSISSSMSDHISKLDIKLSGYLG